MPISCSMASALELILPVSVSMGWRPMRCQAASTREARILVSTDPSGRTMPFSRRPSSVRSSATCASSVTFASCFGSISNPVMENRRSAVSA